MHSYYLIFVYFRKTGAHVVILRSHDFLNAVLFPELLLDFLKEGKRNFIFEIGCSHTDVEQLAILHDMEIVLSVVVVDLALCYFGILENIEADGRVVAMGDVVVAQGC